MPGKHLHEIRAGLRAALFVTVRLHLFGHGQHVVEAAEDDLRARATFESRRVTRLFGIGGTRAIIRKVAGQNAVNVDDVPVSMLPALITELQAQK